MTTVSEATLLWSDRLGFLGVQKKQLVPWDGMESIKDCVGRYAKDLLLCFFSF